MHLPLSSRITSIISMKILLISAGVLSVAMAVKFSVPVLLNFALHDLPATWSVLCSWIQPPYLYFLINVIIFTIFASSRYNLHIHNQSQAPVNDASGLPPVDLPFELPLVSIEPRFGAMELPAVACDIEPRVSEEPVAIDVETVPMSESEVVRVEDEDEFVISRSSWIPPQRISNFPPSAEINRAEFIFPVTEKPLVGSRFAHQKRTKTTPDGVRALKVAKPRKQETKENTWKTTTDGRRMPLKRHLRKSESLENRPRDAAAKAVKKSETFKDRTDHDKENQHPPSTNSSAEKTMKERSPSHDELNRRVEAFIRKFNREMRLQRQESPSHLNPK